MPPPLSTAQESGGRALKENLASLIDLSRRELVARWQDAFGDAPPKKTSRDMMVRALAYRLQEQHEGGLSQSAINRLRRAVSAESGGRLPPAGYTRHLKPGTRLVRE